MEVLHVLISLAMVMAFTGSEGLYVMKKSSPSQHSATMVLIPATQEEDSGLLVRKRRSPEYAQDENDNIRRLDPADLAELLKDTPWALIAIKDYNTQKRGGGNSLSTNFVPRLGRSYHQFSPRLGRSDVQFEEEEDNEEWDGSTTFVPRLGRASRGSGGSNNNNNNKEDGRGNSQQDISATTKFSPRLGRGGFSPRLG